MKKSTFFSLLTFALVLVLGTAYIAFSVLQWRPLADYRSVTMKLDDANQLVPDSSVLLRGVKVGNIQSIDRENGKVVVKFRYDGKYKIPANTGLRIEQLSAVGEPYIDFRPDSLDGPFLADGATIDTAKIKEPLSLPEIFKLISGLTSNINSTDLGGITETLADATSNTQASLPNISQAGDLLARTLTARMPEIRRMMENTQNYQSDMNWLPGALADFGPATRTFVVKNVDLLKALDTLMKGSGSPEALTKSVNPGLMRIAPNTSKLLANLGTINEPLVPVVQALTDVMPQIDVAALLSQALNTVGSDGAANLTVVIPPKK
ncbi:MlaD family protein [Tsukamurella paurometabola]|uniref:Virulence factor Mce family protein n=1 Tax=Tsukamurella paurometabola TaxID=2061 RepID=A0A3P8JWB2_TSUPA|nr:MlaD family protein [Tsukamurella paurometabola]UEA84566.1 MlaD family protein [Tsukamurella paurometabola]VDR37134.1 virulence factor Mce family protein [Tsukamurella paurometabola]